MRIHRYRYHTNLRIILIKAVAEYLPETTKAYGIDMDAVIEWH